MKPSIAILGSAVADVILQVPSLPTREADLHIQAQSMSLGGCAFHVAYMLHLYDIDHLACFPVGSGMYGDFVYQQLVARGMGSFFSRTTAENGCCYCFVEPDGERTFLSYHGAEYQITSSHMKQLELASLSTLYICGLELEEAGGQFIIDYVMAHPTLMIYFAPGPRFLHINEQYVSVLFDHHCILHLNEQEAKSYTQTTCMEEALHLLYEKTLAMVIVTSGSQGCDCYDGQSLCHYPAPIVTQVNTIGAGDAHIGTIIANRALGNSWEVSLQMANKISSAVVSSTSSTLTLKEFHQAIEESVSC